MVTGMTMFGFVNQLICPTFESNTMRSLYMLSALFSFFISGCSSHDEEETLTFREWSRIRNYALVSSKDFVRDELIDLSEPIEIEFGRGSGLDGLNTVRILPNGDVKLFRVPMAGKTTWQYGQFTLTLGEMSRILDSMKATRLLTLQRVYHGGVSDGTQWVLSVRQSSHVRCVYFDNHFPEAIVEFTNSLDNILSNGESRRIVWKPLSTNDACRQQDALWGEIKSR